MTSTSKKTFTSITAVTIIDPAHGGGGSIESLVGGARVAVLNPARSVTITSSVAVADVAFTIVGTGIGGAHQTEAVIGSGTARHQHACCDQW